MSEIHESLIPAIGVVTDVRVDTPDVKTFRVNTLDGGIPFDHKPGPMCHDFYSRRRRGNVFHYFLSNQYRL